MSLSWNICVDLVEDVKTSFNINWYKSEIKLSITWERRCEGVMFSNFSHHPALGIASAGTVLQIASTHCNENVVKMLLDAGADVNAQGGEYGNALQAALYRDNEKVVKKLLSAGADVNAQGGKYGSILRAASYGGDEVLKLLLDADVLILKEKRSLERWGLKAPL